MRTMVTMRATVFLAASLPDGSSLDVGRLPCPYCSDVHVNPEDGTGDWMRFQVEALVAMQASRVCRSCGYPSRVSLEAETRETGPETGDVKRS